MVSVTESYESEIKALKKELSSVRRKVREKQRTIDAQTERLKELKDKSNPVSKKATERLKELEALVKLFYHPEDIPAYHELLDLKKRSFVLDNEELAQIKSKDLRKIITNEAILWRRYRQIIAYGEEYFKEKNEALEKARDIEIYSIFITDVFERVIDFVSVNEIVPDVMKATDKEIALFFSQWVKDNREQLKTLKELAMSQEERAYKKDTYLSFEDALKEYIAKKGAQEV